MFEKLFNNELNENEAKDFLIKLYEKGESAQEIAQAAKIMREHSIKLPITEDVQEKLIDVVGTGGDKSGSFNVSSTVALLLPSLGCYVAKHGNRSVTSKSGSADMLETLGIELDLTPEKQVEMLQRCGFCFIFAKNHHPVMKHIMPIRKSISHRTIFNILGPLTNPAGAKKYLLGVFDKEFVPKLAEALRELGAKRALVVASEEGMDEISISGRTYVAELNEGHITYYEIAPEDFGLQRASFDSILGGDAIHNAKITRAILSGEELGPKRDMVLLNAGAALYADGKVSSIAEGIEMAREAIETKRAQEKLDQIIQTSKELSHGL
ncbi:anthranilate phosphoribosyltransferase [Nitratiruptor sp. SB155-2]|uniref:anthranilate phosphoribosyltransferase n=1 Tax=Nitratiruptor sp. (strain SB155-2) TaxID=387092 RepID=UPI000158700C|nr:anthranilate phosphoribosyltransferase [Nitratiruptor sp. SB155-2]BAF69961.1 anthranilate phosphoribosyltransferase [Nitratiruptor sp. SB155-2]